MRCTGNGIGLRSRGVAKRRRKSSQDRRRFTSIQRCCPYEVLEDRRLLSVVTWDGGGYGVSWSDRFNWNNPSAADPNSLPGPGDDAVINATGVTIVHSGGTDSI